MLSDEAANAYAAGDLADIVYADDTLLIGVNTKFLAQFVAAVASAGKRYGLELHLGKLQLINVGSSATVRLPDGNDLHPKPQMEYLGTALSDAACSDTELSRRIGMAKQDFRHLSRVWNHAGLARKRRLQFYQALIESRFLYSLATSCYTVAQLRRIDGFQAKCIRRVLGIPPAFLSRISNAEVVRKSGLALATKRLEQQQLVLLGKVLRADLDSPLQTSTLKPTGSTQPVTDFYIRKIGRPRKEWFKVVFDIASRRYRGNLYDLAKDERVWKQVLCA